MKRIRVGVNVWDVAYAFGSVWASNNFDGSVSRINPATNRVVKTIKTGGQPSNFAVAADALWVGSNATSGQDVFRIDPATNTSTAVHVGHDSPSGIVTSADAVWTANGGDDTVTRIDPSTKAVVATLKVGSKPAQGAAAPNGTIWIPNFNDNTISVIDPKTNAVVATIKTGKGPVRRAQRLPRHVGRQLPGPRPLAHPALDASYQAIRRQGGLAALLAHTEEDARPTTAPRARAKRMPGLPRAKCGAFRAKKNRTRGAPLARPLSRSVASGNFVGGGSVPHAG